MGYISPKIHAPLAGLEENIERRKEERRPNGGSKAEKEEKGDCAICYGVEEHL